MSPPAATGHQRHRRTTDAAVITACVAAGLVLAVIWSFRFVDRTIGDNVANGLLGYDAKAEPITGTAMATVFALVSGLASTFTACNIAGFSALAPLSDGGPRGWGERLRSLAG